MALTDPEVERGYAAQIASRQSEELTPAQKVTSNMITEEVSIKTESLRTAVGAGYAVILIRGDMDRHQRNVTFAEELTPGFESHGIEVRRLDYITEVRKVSQALRDPDCRFFLCFNGFGSELDVQFSPGHMSSAFDHYQKALFDFMHDCPVHESISHQLGSKGTYRRLLITDYSYAHIARMLGVRNVRAMPSITFPRTTQGLVKPTSARGIDVLLPVGLFSAAWSKERYAAPASYKGRIFREIFSAVTGRASDELHVDPLMHTLLAFQESGILIDFQDPDVRFLVTSILDYVKFERRDRLVRSIQHMPVTVIADRDVQEVYRDTKLRFIGQQSFPDLVRTMCDAKSVICPLPHHSGFHERALAAFTAGAVVLAAPNEILETHFVEGRDMLTYESHEDLAHMLEGALAGEFELEALASNGRARACGRFPPEQIAEILLSNLR